MVSQRRAKSGVSPINIYIYYNAVFLCLDFKDGDHTNRIHWAYKLKPRYKLTVHIRTSISQLITDAMLPVEESYCKRNMTLLHNVINDRKYLIIMDEPCILELNTCAYRASYGRAYSVNKIRESFINEFYVGCHCCY